MFCCNLNPHSRVSCWALYPGKSYFPGLACGGPCSLSLAAGTIVRHSRHIFCDIAFAFASVCGALCDSDFCYAGVHGAWVVGFQPWKGVPGHLYSFPLLSIRACFASSATCFLQWSLSPALPSPSYSSQRFFAFQLAGGGWGVILHMHWSESQT